ncbi:MAG: hypothetical protein J5746_04085 [Victivallales bacterium]|nr:hypothetical protein [Victivallales bacterium]
MSSGFDTNSDNNTRFSVYEGEDIGAIRRVGRGAFSFPGNSMGDNYRALLNSLEHGEGDFQGLFRRTAKWVRALAMDFVQKYPDLNSSLHGQLKAVEAWAGTQENPDDAFAEAFQDYMLFGTVPQAEGQSELAWGFAGLKGVLISVYRNNHQAVIDGDVRAILDSCILADEIVENTLHFDELVEALSVYARNGLAGIGSYWDIVHIAEKARNATIQAQAKVINAKLRELRRDWKDQAQYAAGQIPAFALARNLSYSDMMALHDFAQWLYGEGRQRVKDIAQSRGKGESKTWIGLHRYDDRWLMDVYIPFASIGIDDPLFAGPIAVNLYRNRTRNGKAEYAPPGHQLANISITCQTNSGS